PHQNGSRSFGVFFTPGPPAREGFGISATVRVRSASGTTSSCAGEYPSATNRSVTAPEPRGTRTAPGAEPSAVSPRYTVVPGGTEGIVSVTSVAVVALPADEIEAAPE